MEEDIRWKQRFGNYLKALGQLRNLKIIKRTGRTGLIQAFEFTHELAWNVMGFLNTRGNTMGSRDATRSLSKGLIQDGAQWMEMIKVETNLHIL
jgi:hypothetical protein